MSSAAGTATPATPIASWRPTPAPATDTTATDFLDALAFERVIFLKPKAAWLLEQELKRIDPAQEIALGTATDPYQPIERKARITRSVLEVFSRKQGFRLGIVTKSTLVERDLDLLAKIAEHNTLIVHITITTADAQLARKLEPRAPLPSLRFKTVRRLRDAGITTGILCSPLFPGITDSKKAIDGMARRAAAAGASFFAAGTLFLKPCSRLTYLSFIGEHFPTLVAEYSRRFGKADFAAGPYRRQMASLVARACRVHRPSPRSSDALLTRSREPNPTQSANKPPRSIPASQQRLFA